MDILKLLFFMYLAIFILIFPIVRRTKKEENDQISTGMEFFVVACLALLVFIPIAGILFASYAFFDFSSMLKFIEFSNNTNAILYVLIVLISLCFVEPLITPILKGVSTLIIPASFVHITNPVIEILVNSLLVYGWSMIIPGIFINGFLGALGIAVLYYILSRVVFGRNKVEN
ncbi:hypothetical protein B9G55_06350 [Saccharibacillus sp. O16]|nr:hypothetical protein B9G55_06350 [Saccharibacillus sp. O16]